MGKKRRLLDEYRFPGYRPRANVRGEFGDPRARIIWLERAQKKRFVAVVAGGIGATTTRRYGGYGTCRAAMRGFTWRWRFGGSFVGGAER